MIGKNIQAIRKNKKIQAKYMAEQLGVSSSTYSKWENESRDIPTSFIPEIAKLLNVSVNVLFCIEEADSMENYKSRHRKEVTTEILNYLINRWDGDVDSAVQLFACYASLPVDLRKEIATFCMVYFSESLDVADKDLTGLIDVERCKQIVDRLQKEKKEKTVSQKDSK